MSYLVARTTRTLITLATLAVVAPAVAVDGHGGHAAMMPAANAGTSASASASAAAKSPWVDGQVKKVDRSAGKVTLAHGPLTHLGMDMPMTMAFRVKNPVWLDQIKPSDALRFVAEDIDGALTIVNLERAE